MKTLVLPENTDSVIYVNNIGTNYKGIILCYKENSPVGYITACDDYWFINSVIDSGIPDEDFRTLIDAVNFALEEKFCTEFKVVEFK